MKKIDIIIPTRNRAKKLERCLASIPERDDINIIVGIDDDSVTEAMLNKHKRKVKIVKSADHIGSVAMRNVLSQMTTDGCLYMTDDAVFMPKALDGVISLYNNLFPENDGIMGFRQNHDHHPAGVALVGKTIINKCPNRQLFYPGY